MKLIILDKMALVPVLNPRVFMPHVWLLLMMFFSCGGTNTACGQVYEKLARFVGTDGNYPRSSLVQGIDGFFYGTTHLGGSNDQGTVFKVSASGTLTTLAHFTGSNGAYPKGALVQGSDGNFYGTTSDGDITSRGKVFRVSPTGTLTVLANFTGPNGSAPAAGLVQGSDGDFYGTTFSGGSSNLGTVFKVSASGTLTTLVNFTGNNGREPEAALIHAGDGNFYGTTSRGGGSNLGTVFKMTPAGTLTTLVEFTGNGTTNKGSLPRAGLAQGGDGSFYGTTSSGGTADMGTVFKVSSLGVLETLVHFSNSNGESPVAALSAGSDGNFYGSTWFGGGSDLGLLFKMTPSGVLTPLVSFTGSNGSRPWAALVQGSDGDFYGTTRYGGSADVGSVFRVTSSGLLTPLVSFVGNTGRNPNGAGVQDSEGNYLGTTFRGGPSDLGTIFKLTPTGGLSTVANFSGGDGSYLEAPMIRGSDGNLYGTTSGGGGNDLGTIFRMTPTGTVTMLAEFNGNNGSEPLAELVEGSDGNFYGTTLSGGTSDLGTVFKVTPAGVLTRLVSFSGSNGSAPWAALILGSDGNFYGTTSEGGTSDKGTVFKMTPAGTLTTLVQFAGASNGQNPLAALVQGADGNLYGTTDGGGSSNRGTVFKTTTSGALTTLVHFTGANGSYPSDLVRGGDGNFYGPTYAGGSASKGTLFQMTPAGVLVTIFDFASDGVDVGPQTLSVAADGDFYGVTATSIFRLLHPGPPIVGNEGAKSISADAAVMEGKINARGASTVTTIEFGTDGISFPNVLATSPASLSSYQTTLVGASQGGLIPGTTYYYRIRATNSFGTRVSPVANFTTLTAPLVTSNPASEITPTSARFNGAVNARNHDATAVFEWGTDGISFPNQVAAVPATLTGDMPVPVSVAVAGLVKGTDYFYRLVATNAAGTVVSETQTFRTLTDPTTSIGGSFVVSTTSVRVEGAVNAQGSDASVVFEYGTDGVTFPSSIAATPGMVTGSSATPVEATLTNLLQGVTYHYRIKATSAGGVSISTSASFQPAIISGLTQQFPTAPPASNGSLTVTLAPTGLLSGWRFVGEHRWRASGDTATGLVHGSRVLEFRPVPGYLQPGADTVNVTSAGQIADYEYYATPSAGTGGVLVVLKPDTLAQASNVADRGQWRLLGETAWRDSATTASSLPAGSYLVECKAVAGYSTPVLVNVTVSSGQTVNPTIVYADAFSPTGTPPVVVSFSTVSTDATKPYGYVGQIRSNSGVGTGFAVKSRVVATAAHVVFDEGSQSSVQGLQWLLQEDAGGHEPLPVTPRGYYLIDGYAAQRASETPGSFSLVSRQKDVAALYFINDTNAARTGFAGFLASDLANNEFLISSAQKMLVGYPVDGIPTLDQGRMHATPAANLTFTGLTDRVFATTDIRSTGGNSGGPLCVQHTNGNWYPAAIYLGGATQSIVRAIDSTVIQLFNTAQQSGIDDQGYTGGGITHTGYTAGGTDSTGALVVNITPSAGTGWRPVGSSKAFTPGGVSRAGLTPGTFSIEFTPLAGYQTPAHQPVTVVAASTQTYAIAYQPSQTPQETWRQQHFGTTSNTGNAADTFDFDGDGFTNAQEYAAGSNPTLSGDFFKASNPQRSGNAFSVSAAGKAGRAYVLECSTTLAQGSWTVVATQAALAADGPVMLTDAASPPGAAFYRVRVTGP